MGGVASKVLAGLDHFVPPALRDAGSDVRWRARLIVGGAAIAFSIVCFVLVDHIWVGLYAIAAAMVAFLTLLAMVPVVLRITGSIRLAANALTALVFLVTVGFTVGDGGRGLYPLVFSCVVPVLGLLLDGRASGLAWAVITCGSLFAAANFGSPVPGFPFDERAVAEGPHRFRVATRLVVVFASLTFFLEWLWSRAVQEREEALAARRDSEARYRLITDNARDLIAELDAQGRYLYASPSFREVLGRAPGELIGTSCFELLHPGDQESSRDQYPRVLLFGQSVRTRQRVRHADGSWRWIESGTRAYRDDVGRFRVVTTARDVTDRVEAQHALETRVQQQRAVADLGVAAVSVPDLKALYEGALDLVKRTLDVSACVIFERAEADDSLVLRAATEAGSPWLGRHVKEANTLPLYALHSTEPVLVEDFTAERRFIPATGVIEHGVRSAIGLGIPGPQSPQGVITAYSCAPRHFSRDDVHFLQSIAMLLGVAMDRDRSRRQAEEMRGQLLRSQKLEALGRLAGGVAHDFNNLLTVITGHSELLAKRLEVDSREQAMAVEVVRASERAAALTRQLLTFSRRRETRATVLELDAVVLESEQMLQRVIGEDVFLQVVSHDEVGRVAADRSQVEQILLNLVVNARDALGVGGRIRIETRNVDPAKLGSRFPTLESRPYVGLVVEDDGTGMDAETLERIFEPFFTTKQPGVGTGLGLAMVYGIAKQSGGDVWVESRPGEGTRIEVLFPRVFDTPVELPVGPRIRVPGGDETVLLAEDEPAVLELVATHLRERGYRVLEARTGKEALAVAESHAGRIDLLLSDVVMPEMGGPILAERLVEQRPDVQVLFMSGYPGGPAFPGTNDPLRHERLLYKPFTAERLARAVRTALDPEA